MTKNNFINKLALIFIWPFFCLITLVAVICIMLFCWFTIPIVDTSKVYKCMDTVKNTYVGGDTDEKS